MAKVLCLVTECKYCGRKSRVYHCANGQPLYTCKRESIVIDEPCDPESVIKDEIGLLPYCRYFKHKEETNNAR